MTVWKNKKPRPPKPKRSYYFEAKMLRMSGEQVWTRSIPYHTRALAEKHSLLWRAEHGCEVRVVEE